MVGWFTTVKEPPPLLVSSYGKSDRDLRRMRILVREKEEEREEKETWLREEIRAHDWREETSIVSTEKKFIVRVSRAEG